MGAGRPSANAGEFVAILFQKKSILVDGPKFWSNLRLRICCFVGVTITGFQFNVVWLPTAAGIKAWIFSATGSMRAWGIMLPGNGVRIKRPLESVVVLAGSKI